jgi:CheY-like chemotaxis protein
MTIDSVVGAGTRIGLHLPEADEAAAAPAFVATAQSGSGVILVVEDDLDVRELVVLQLKDLGYVAIVAGSGPEALDILASPETPAIDLLLTDVVMPGGMTGHALAREAKRRRPGLKALLTSGYMAASGADTPEVDAADLTLLSKPYQQAELGRAVQAALAGR